MFVLLAVMQASYRLKGIFPSNQLFLLQLKIQTGHSQVIFDTNKGEDTATSEQFPLLCLKSRKPYKSPCPRMNKTGIYTKHTSSQPSGYVPIPNLHVRKTRHTSKSWGYEQFSKLEWVGIPEVSHSYHTDPKSRSMQFYGKLATLISFRGHATSQTNHFGFPSTVLLLARWGDLCVGAPCSACKPRLWEPQISCAWPKSPIHLLQVFPPS